jgi:flagellar motor switch protein FliG
MKPATLDRPLTGVQKAAVILMQMDQASAVQVMKQFTETEAEELSTEIMALRKVSPDVAEQTINEFHELAVAGRRTTRGGRDFAESLLEASFGSEKANGLMNRLASTMAGRSFEFLETADPGQILTLIDSELPQTIALVLAHLRPDTASLVLAGLADGQRSDVAHAIASMGTPSPEAVNIVAETLKVRAGAVVAPREAATVVGGIQPLVEIINRSDITTEKAVLEGLDSIDKELADEVRSRMLTFADIVKLERRDLQQVLQELEITVLARAMKNAAAPVIEAIQANVSDRKKTILEGEIAAVGAIRMKEIEEARAEIVRRVRQLEAEGTITVRRGDEDEIVY